MSEPYVQYYYRKAMGSGLPTFRGIGMQRGHGLGGLLNAAFRTIAPALKQVGKSALRQGATAGARIIGDVVEGRDSLGSSAKRHLLASGKRVIDNVLSIAPAPRRRKTVTKKRSGGLGVFNAVLRRRKRGRRVKKKGLATSRLQLGRGRRRGLLAPLAGKKQN